MDIFQFSQGTRDIKLNADCCLLWLLKIGKRARLDCEAFENEA